jgi:hypothetical protein
VLPQPIRDRQRFDFDTPLAVIEKGFCWQGITKRMEAEECFRFGAFFHMKVPG